MIDWFDFVDMSTDEMRAEAAARNVPLLHSRDTTSYADTVGELVAEAKKFADQWGVDADSVSVEAYDDYGSPCIMLQAEAPLRLDRKDDRRLLFDKLAEADRLADLRRQRDLQDLARLKAQYETKETP